MGLISLNMELLISRDSTQTLMHVIQDALNKFKIFFVNHLHQGIVLAEEVETHISFA